MLYTGSRIDHDTLCSRLAEGDRCLVEFDVAVSPPRSQVISVSIQVVDQNDNHPQFPSSHITLDLSEGARIGSTLNISPAVDPDSVPRGIIGYELTTPSEYFELRVRDLLGGHGSVKLELVQELDRELLSVHQLVLQASDGGIPSNTGSVRIDILVGDANDHVPHFESNTDTYTSTIPEDISIGGSVITISAVDEDDGENGRIEYYIASTGLNGGSNPINMFELDPATGVITVTALLDYELESSYVMVVEAIDSGTSPNTAYATVTIRVSDVNDNPPQISINTLTSSEIAEVPEDATPGTFVTYVSVRDPDQGGLEEFSCSLSDTSVFNMEPLQRTRYRVITHTTLDRESVAMFNLTVTCQDSGTDPIGLSKSHDIQIVVIDINDNRPIFTPETFSALIEENNDIGDFILQVTAHDGDFGINGEVTYQLAAEVSEYFTLNPQSGVIRANTVFDYERIPELTFVVYSVDRGVPVQTSSAVVALTIEDTNDEAPTFLQSSYTFHVREEQDGGTEVGQVSATDADSHRYSGIEYSFRSSSSTSGRFSIDPNTGIIRTAKVLRREERPIYYLTVVASNGGSVSPVLSGSASVTVSILDINNNPPIITYPTSTNHTITISSGTPVGETIASVEAYDMDEGINARLRYLITSLSSNDDAVDFLVDPTSGAISSVASLRHINGVEQFEYDIKVSDGIHEVHQYMLFVVDSSVPYGGATSSNDKSLLSGSNLTIVVAMTVSCAVIVIILMIAIIIIRGKDKRRRMRKHNNSMAMSPEGQLYHCQIEAQHTPGHQNNGMVEYDDNKSHHIPIRQSGNSLSAATGKKAVSFRSTDNPHKPVNSWPTRGHDKKVSHTYIFIAHIIFEEILMFSLFKHLLN